MNTILISTSDSIKYYDTKIGRKRCIKTFLYKCFCGNEFISRITPTHNLPSCGCLKAKIGDRTRKHGYTEKGNRHKLYGTWRGMIGRCYCESDINYRHYGGRGIEVCERWRDKLLGFPNFLEDMGEKPSKKHSIDRIEVNGNYEPSNCRWATQIEQNNNRRDNIIIIYKGLKKTISEWSRITGLKKNTLIYRIRKGWNPIDIIDNPARKYETYVQI